MANFEKQLLERLDRITAKDCDVCSTRRDRCPRCHRPVGPTPNEADRALAVLNHRLSQLADRMDSGISLLSPYEGLDEEE